jgi:hypothetical protein
MLLGRRQVRYASNDDVPCDFSRRRAASRNSIENEQPPPYDAAMYSAST